VAGPEKIHASLTISITSRNGQGLLSSRHAAAASERGKSLRYLALRSGALCVPIKPVPPPPPPPPPPRLVAKTATKLSA